MDTDRELLEAAANAAGMNIEWQPCGWAHNNETLCEWNPLTDDGDALRLAVKLGIKFIYNEALGQGLAWTGGVPDFEAQANIEDCGRNETTCARRAIVRAAAAIGRSMK
jgi:hypothetical protein